MIEIKRIAKDEIFEVHQEDEWDAPCVDSFQNIFRECLPYSNANARMVHTMHTTLLTITPLDKSPQYTYKQH